MCAYEIGWPGLSLVAISRERQQVSPRHGLCAPGHSAFILFEQCSHATKGTLTRDNNLYLLSKKALSPFILAVLSVMQRGA